MESVVFQSIIENDVIIIPKQYRGLFSSPVIVTIAKDIQNKDGLSLQVSTSVLDEEKDLSKKQAAFQRLLTMIESSKKSLPADFDYKEDMVQTSGREIWYCMIILIDTNILIDFFAKREPFFNSAMIIMQKCSNGEIVGYIAEYTIPTVFYILRKQLEYCYQNCVNIWK
ncbi:hypothetical protein FACS1894172_03100 [Spirochaetia bacterium]|nr:hypothetical protein FACS1894172_03100 [Spirochaetia bacterium]